MAAHAFPSNSPCGFSRSEKLREGDGDKTTASRTNPMEDERRARKKTANMGFDLDNANSTKRDSLVTNP